MELNSEQHKTHDLKHRPSNSELMSSAKVVAEAAKFGLNNEMDQIDKGKVAGAAADLIDAASHYGKLEETGMGKYVEKGEQYLHQYNSSNPSTTTHSTATATPDTTASSQSHPSGAGAGAGAGAGSGHSESGGYGDYINMAQGFFKKH